VTHVCGGAAATADTLDDAQPDHNLGIPCAAADTEDARLKTEEEVAAVHESLQSKNRPHHLSHWAAAALNARISRPT